MAQIIVSPANLAQTVEEIKKYIDNTDTCSGGLNIGVKFNRQHIPETQKYANSDVFKDAYILIKINSDFETIYNKKDELYLQPLRHLAKRGFYPYNDIRKFTTTYEESHIEYDENDNEIEVVEKYEYPKYYCWKCTITGDIFYSDKDENDEDLEEANIYVTPLINEYAGDVKWLQATSSNFHYYVISMLETAIKLKNLGKQIKSSDHYMDYIERCPNYDVSGELKNNYLGNMPITPIKLSDLMIYISDGRILTWDDAYAIKDNKKLKPIDEHDWYVIVPYTALEMLGREIDLLYWKVVREEMNDDISLSRPYPKNTKNFIIFEKDSKLPINISYLFGFYICGENIKSNQINIKISSDLTKLTIKEY